MPDISLSAFANAAGQLRGNQSVRFNVEHTALAETIWQRFAVALKDGILNRDENAIAAEKSAVRNAFLEAVRREQGPQMADLANAQFAEGLGLIKTPLKAKRVMTTMALLESKGGKNWIVNERAISRAAQGATHASRESGLPTLSEIVCPVCNQLRREINTLPPALRDTLNLAGLIESHANAALASDQQSTRIPHLSDTIEYALREAAQTRDDKGNFTGLRLLDQDEITRIASDAIKTEITRHINTLIRKHYENEHAFRDDLATKTQERGLEQHLPVFTSEPTYSQIRELETYAIHDRRSLLPPDTLAELRATLINSLLTRQHEKLDEIAGLKLADSPARAHLIKTCMETRSRMDSTYFAQLGIAAKSIGEFSASLRAGTLEENRAALLQLGRTLGDCIEHSAPGIKGGDDIGHFMTLCVDLFKARNPEIEVDAVKGWLSSQEGLDMQNDFFELGASADNTEASKHNAIHAAYLMTSLSAPD